MYENACPVLLGQWAAMNNSRVQVTAIIPAQPQWEEATKPKKKLDFLEIQMQIVQSTNRKAKTKKGLKILSSNDFYCPRKREASMYSSIDLT